MTFKFNLFTGAAVIACAMAGAASAQELAGATTTDGNFNRDRNVSVMQHARPGYEAIGLRIGGFVAWPKLTSTAEYNDNIYATTAKTNDMVYHLSPELQLTSTWSRHMLNAYVKGAIHRYADFKGENTEDWSVGADGRLDVQRGTSIGLGGSTASVTEPRSSASSPATAVNPVEYQLTTAKVSATHEFNRLRVHGEYVWQKYDYDDVLNGAGGVIDQDGRDREVNTFMARAEYAVSPDTALFVQTSANQRNYDITPAAPALRRDSDGVEVLGGANFDIGALMRGEIGVGYMKQSYDDPALASVDGVGARAVLEWFPTELITVTTTGSRTIEETTLPGASGYVSTSLSAKVDYELLRNVLLGAGVNYGHDKYKGRSLAAVRAYRRTDERIGGDISATYLLNANVGISVFYNYTKTTSSGLDRFQDYNVNKVGAKLVLQY